MTDYTTLVTALPYLSPLPKLQQLPISRIALERRLSMLSDEDRQQLQWAERLYHPEEGVVSDLPDPVQVRDWQEQLERIESPLIRERITLRLEWRTLLAALRYRQQQRLEPEHFHGFGRWTAQIRRRWHDPLFGMEATLPFLAELQPLLTKGLSGELEQQLNAYLWQDLLLAERRALFTLDAVICFVLRWDLAEKHLRSDATQALDTFQQLTGTLLDAPGIRQSLESAFEELS